MSVLVWILAALAVGVAGLWAWAASDARADARAMDGLRALQPADPPRFDPAMVADLPDPARRYLTYTIAPGTPLTPVAEIEMRGSLGLGDKAAPNYAPMRAVQVLAPPHGFVWRVRTGRLPVVVTGSDGLDGGQSWSRFRLFGLVPVARAGGGRDHARAAFGRVVAEAVFWTPAALLPSESVTWEPVNAETARAVMTRGKLGQAVEVTVNPDGQPTRVRIQRWTDANPDRTYRLQPFGGELSGFRDFDGFRLPTRVDGGNFFGTPQYFPFFRAEVEAIRFPPPR